MTKAFPITNASISTATVDIQVMRIGTKQMTLAVFRQLPRLSIFTQSGNLVASPWGWVNYDHDYGTPFIFSHEGILYRSTVDITVYNNLQVEQETEKKWTGARYEDIPNGKWIVSPTEKYTASPIDKKFSSEEAARSHLQNRFAALSILKAAPQLFIAV